MGAVVKLRGGSWGPLIAVHPARSWCQCSPGGPALLARLRTLRQFLTRAFMRARRATGSGVLRGVFGGLGRRPAGPRRARSPVQIAGALWTVRKQVARLPLPGYAESEVAGTHGIRTRVESRSRFRQVRRPV